MAAYRAGGLPYRLAARWAYGELLAIYRGRHYRGGERTPPPGIPPAEGLRAAEAALREVRGAYEEA
jgi:hypothetical protein